MAEKTYTAASLIELKDKIFRPGDPIEGISKPEETELLASGMIYELPNAKSKGSMKESKKIKELEEECKEKDIRNKELEASIIELEEKNEQLLEKIKELEAGTPIDAKEDKAAEGKK